MKMIKNEFVLRYMPIALIIEKETGIFALAALTQAALETGWGNHVKGENYFGIKSGEHGKKQLIKTTEIHKTNTVKYPHIISITPFVKDGKQLYRYLIEDWFFYYENPIDSFRAYADFIKQNKRYGKALEQKTPEAYLKEVAKAGYATDPDYNSKLQSVLKTIKEMM